MTAVGPAAGGGEFTLAFECGAQQIIVPDRAAVVSTIAYDRSLLRYRE